MYWMLGGLNDWNGGGKIKLDALVDLNNKCTGSKSGGAAGAWQTSGNYELSTQGFRTGVWQDNEGSEWHQKQAKAKAAVARQGATSNGMSELDLGTELVVGSVSLRYRLDLKYNVGPADALDISFRSNNNYGQKKQLHSSGGNSRNRTSSSVPGVAGIKALGYVSDLVIGSSVLGTSSGANVCAPTETSGSNLVSAVITLKSLDKLKSAHTQFFN